ncbi:hypothetical protein EVAR_5078_1 [Eumeta japonica]|uniref:Uncharacterized protein n=1 Tax=Eumeta variegata TaxID=151549 RepID=A0A4C1SXK6_EUMVA|nr:hypothetical protein EVAR_5078_1 [Eumeta japonica]
MMSVYTLTTPLNFRLAREFSKFGPPKWGHHHWTVGDVSLTRRRPGITQHKPSIPHLHPQKKGCGRSVNERSSGTITKYFTFPHAMCVVNTCKRLHRL